MDLEDLNGMEYYIKQLKLIFILLQNILLELNNLNLIVKYKYYIDQLIINY